ncbi:hypothetical protein Misp01_74160 [Microtetraspora sp. NBRC 13810]|uniref:polymorphic toxin-type HINT domain-containing protein n=1 Tax=Microtetraspora sp. NBRC 13810 TaxID=3030990 RepID=UPI0024A2DDCD|nr:polymorphic toxin-type HINT domain-containing protein [Microtetraspora sp. NBRC 13810]GLW12288.1 hypothetical protein Misp01_74160 [Microtetraspora sp. NBRC 13810]
MDEPIDMSLPCMSAMGCAKDIVEEVVDNVTEDVVDEIIDQVAPELPLVGLPGDGLGSCDRRPNSFVPGTPVLMADGTSKPIEDVKVGDHVIATDPETGITGPRPVTTLITGDGTKNLVKLTIDIDGTRGTATDVVTATDEHPFWIPALREWLPAGQLQPGMWLQTSAGTHVQLTAVQKWTTTQRVHNLTVDELHTYHVVAGTTPVLVHNCPAEKPGFFKRVFGKKEAAPAPGPNARVGDLRSLESDGSYSATKAEDLRDLEDDELMAAAQQTQLPDAMYVYKGGNVLGNGNHRMRELLRRADSPNSSITDDTPIYILGFGN